MEEAGGDHSQHRPQAVYEGSGRLIERAGRVDEETTAGESNDRRARAGLDAQKTKRTRLGPQIRGELFHWRRGSVVESPAAYGLNCP